MRHTYIIRTMAETHMLHVPWQRHLHYTYHDRHTYITRTMTDTRILHVPWQRQVYYTYHDRDTYIIRTMAETHMLHVPWQRHVYYTYHTETRILDVCHVLSSSSSSCALNSWCGPSMRCPRCCDSISFPLPVSSSVATAVRVHVSHAYRKMESTSARRSLILYFMVMLLSLHIVFSFDSAVIVCAALARTSGLDPSSLMIAPYIYIYMERWNVVGSVS